MHHMLFAAFGASAALSGCAIREAHIATTPELAAVAERLELSGMGAGERGALRLGSAIGRFARSAERLGVFDPLLVEHRGGGAFEIKLAPGGPDLAGRCTYRQNMLNAGPISITPDRLAFRCEFARDRRLIDAALLIADPKPALGRSDGREERIGSFVIEGREIVIRSIHRDAGGGLPLPTPLGYSFSDGGREIGAIDLNGANKTLYVPREGPDREAIILASLALATFWDPSESAD